MSYAKGTRGEKKSRRWLEARGFFVVESRGSHGACDLVAIDHTSVRIVQVKSGRKPTTAETLMIVRELYKTPCPANGTREIHYWADYAREPVVEVV